MPAHDPRIDAYIAKSAEFARPVLEHLRAQVHAACPDAEETIKWGMPHFMLDGKILAGMAAFKAHCSLGFWQREAVEPADAEKRHEAMGQFGRLTGLADLPTPSQLRGAIKKAAALIRAGAKPQRAARAPRPPLEVPAELLAALAAHPAARRSFEAFPPSKQRDYIEWIGEAKREDTRAKRLAQSLEWLAEGKSRNWKYESC